MTLFARQRGTEYPTIVTFTTVEVYREMEELAAEIAKLRGVSYNRRDLATEVLNDAWPAARAAFKTAIAEATVTAEYFAKEMTAQFTAELTEQFTAKPATDDAQSAEGGDASPAEDAAKPATAVRTDSDTRTWVQVGESTLLNLNNAQAIQRGADGAVTVYYDSGLRQSTNVEAGPGADNLWTHARTLARRLPPEAAARVPDPAG